MTKKLTVRANGFTKTAEEKIKSAGGRAEVIEKQNNQRLEVV